MKKKLLTLFLSLLTLFSAFALPASAAFTDISDPDTALAVAVLESMGVVDGVSEDTYNPNGTFTRAQFCAIAVRAMGLEDKAESYSYKTVFSDVKPGSWYVGYVNLAYAEGIINGYGNGRFGPDDSVTYGQVATILLRLLGYTENEIGKVWPTDYVNFASSLELNKGVTLGANSAVTRAQAAVLLYNTMKTAINGDTTPYYKTMKNVSATQEVIILSNSASNGGGAGQLMTYTITATGASVEYYGQKNVISDDMVGYIGTLLLNSAGKTIGFVPDGGEFADVTVSSAKVSGITSDSGAAYRISGDATVIYDGSLYPYGSTGYIQVNNQSGKNVRLYYNDDGGVSYIYITSGSSSAGIQAAVAETDSAANELARSLGITGSGYSITKNGSAAAAGDIAKYDVAYYDAAARMMCVSDYRITGYIEAASPAVSGAKTITVAGCSLEVLESAWDTLEEFRIGERVTLLLTDDRKVAAAYAPSAMRADMMGVLSADGSFVTLSGSGLVLTADKVLALNNLYGTLVKVAVTEKNSISCSAFTAASGDLNISARTLGEYKLAPSCSIYEHASDGYNYSYAYSLSGVQGESSPDFGELIWASALDSSYVSYYRLNSAGQVDILLLKEVTGNCYDYGKIKVYYDTQGINLGKGDMDAYNNAATITNAQNPGESSKFLCLMPTKSGACAGVSKFMDSSGYERVSSISSLTKTTVDASAFFLSEDDWYVTVNGYKLAVSGSVEVYLSAVGAWYSGDDGLLTALASGMTLTAYYDRTPDTGAQVRIITAE